MKSVTSEKIAQHLNEKSTTKRGTISELAACRFLLREGYEVFRNVCSTGPVDLVGLKDGKTYLFDVKTVMLHQKKDSSWSLYTSDKLKENQKDLSVSILYAAPDGFCGFKMTSIAAHYRSLGLKVTPPKFCSMRETCKAPELETEPATQGEF